MSDSITKSMINDIIADVQKKLDEKRWEVPLDSTSEIRINTDPPVIRPVGIWETDPNKKPSDDMYRLCGNNIIGCFMAAWNGFKWQGEHYEEEDGYLTRDPFIVDYWLRTPKDDQ